MVKTTYRLPKGKTMEDYDKPSMVGRASKAPEDLKNVMEQVYNGNKVIRVPTGRTRKTFILRIREYLARRGKKVKVAVITDDELYVRIKGE